MTYLDFERLEAIDPGTFQDTKPYPWVNPEGLLTPEGFARLAATLPELSLFEERFGVRRKHGQQPHDRFTLEYAEGLDVAAPWHEFLAELRSDRYRRDLCRLFGVSSLELNFHWHYTPTGCSVSPHCDSTRKLGSHIFYFNTKQDWDPRWGGETVILDDGGRLSPRSAPAWEDFDSEIASESIGNRSLLFQRRSSSWHGVRELRCPEGLLRKVFIVVVNSDGPLDKLRALIQGRSAYRY